MNATLTIPQHEPLPPNMTLREIAKRHRRAILPTMRQLPVENPMPVLPPPNAPLRLCKSCLLSLRRTGFRMADQIWSCLNCGQARAWGLVDPENRKLRPVLKCLGCNCHERHGFVGVIGRTL